MLSAWTDRAVKKGGKEGEGRADRQTDRETAQTNRAMGSYVES